MAPWLFSYVSNPLLPTYPSNHCLTTFISEFALEYSVPWNPDGVGNIKTHTRCLMVEWHDYYDLLWLFAFFFPFVLFSATGPHAGPLSKQSLFACLCGICSNIDVVGWVLFC